MDILILLPLLSAISTFLMGLFVFLKGRREQVNIIFFIFSIFVSIWLGGTSILLSSCGSDAKAIFWDRIVYLAVIFIPPTCYHFSSLFAGVKKNKILIVSAYLISLFFAIISQTDHFVYGLIQYSWGCHTKAGLFHDLFLIFFAFFIALVFVNLANGIKKSSGINKVQIKFILVAFIVLGFGIAGILPAYGFDMYPFTYLCGLVAVVIMGYAIIKHHLLSVKVITTEIFSVLVSMVLLVNTLLSTFPNPFILNFFLFAAISIFSVMLIMGVLKEVRSREELSKLTDELQRANEDLKKLDKAKTEFISIASHQLRTPLSIIKGFVSMIIEGSYGPVSGEIKDVLGKVEISNERLTNLINDLLDISRMEGGRMQFKWEYIPIAELAKSVVDELRPAADKKQLKLIFSSQLDEKILVRADQEKLRQVIMNLVDNAIKYTPQGSVEVKLTRTPENWARLAIKDTGIGMDAEEQALIFGKFVRGKKTARLWTEGTGLGLYVARKIIEEHKGKVWAESAGENQGSTFYIEIPTY